MDRETEAILSLAIDKALDNLERREGRPTNRRAPYLTKAMRDRAYLTASEGNDGSSFNGAEVKAAQRELGMERAYGRDVHTCSDPDCSNKDHGLTFARYLRAVASRSITKATGGLLEGTGGVGGYIVPQIYETDLVPLLRATSVVRAIGTPVLPMSERIHYMPRQSGSGTAYWGAEAAQTTASNQAFEQIVYTAHDLTALSFFSNDLLMDSHPEADRVVRDDLLATVALKQDEAFLLGGAGISASAPTGIYSKSAAFTYAVQSNVQNIHLTGGASITPDDLQNAIYLLRSSNVKFRNCAWVMNPRDAYTIRRIKDADGLPIFRDASDFTVGQSGILMPTNGLSPSGNLLGYPVWETTQMPTDDTLVATHAGSAIILGDWSEAMIGDRQQMEVAATSEATVIDPDGSTAVNLFATNQSAIRVVARLDFQLKHPKAFVVIDTIPA